DVALDHRAGVGDVQRDGVVEYVDSRPVRALLLRNGRRRQEERCYERASRREVTHRHEVEVALVDLGAPDQLSRPEQGRPMATKKKAAKKKAAPRKKATTAKNPAGFAQLPPQAMFLDAFQKEHATT